MKRGSKQWWSTARRTLELKGRVSNIPALKVEGQWLTSAKEKANAIANVLQSKCVSDKVAPNKFTPKAHPDVEVEKAECPSLSSIQKLLSALKNTATGPDLVPARVLRECAPELAVPVQLLLQLILKCKVWPWRTHWLCPLHKKKSLHNPAHYRGVHLTPQVSKVIERALAQMIITKLLRDKAFGELQFAYMSGRGARDALALLTLSWIAALNTGKKVGLYCSDVSGAFDRKQKFTTQASTRMCKECWVRGCSLVAPKLFSKAHSLKRGP